MRDHDRNAARFNESARRAASGLPPPVSGPGNRVDRGNGGFRTYRVTTAGQMTLPSSARSSWELKEGGEVLVAHIGDFVLVVRPGAWTDALRQWRLEDVLTEDFRREIEPE